MFTKQEMADTIKGKTKWRKCINCEGSGWENWDEYGLDVKHGMSDKPERCNGECEDCNGLGYVVEYD